MRFLGMFLLAASAGAQVQFPTSQTALRGPAPVARHGRAVRGYWGAGYWGWPAPRAETTVMVTEPKAAVLASSPLYQADRAQPVMREYGELPPPGSQTVTLIAFREGRIATVQAYWVEGERLGYVTADDVVHFAPLLTVDAARSEKLNQQKGGEFRLPRR